MSRCFWIVVLSGWLFAAFSDRLAAEPVSYPDDHPVFTVDVPQGWQAKHQNGAVTIAAQANAVVLLQHVDTLHDDATAKAALPQLANMQGQQFNLNNMRISTHVRDFGAGEFKGFMTDGRGVDNGGHDTLWQVMVFAPEPGHYCLVTSMWTNEDGDKTLGERTAIFQSLKVLTRAR